MTAPAPDFASAIRTAAAEIGQTPTGDQVAALNHEMQSAWHIDLATGHVNVVVGGRAMSVPSAVAEAAKAWAQPDEPTITDDRWVKAEIGSSTGWRRANDPMFGIVQNIEAAHQRDLAREIAEWPNPFATKTANRTRQVILQKHDPALAARLQTEAGVRAR